MMNCRIFRSERKNETYLYLLADKDFDDLPEELQSAFGDPGFVMNLEVTPMTKLARVDVEQVLERLQEDGYYLQMPPSLPLEEEITRWLE